MECCQWPRVQLRAGDGAQSHSKIAKEITLGLCPENPREVRVSRDRVGPENGEEGPVSQEMGVTSLGGYWEAFRKP